MTVKFDKQAYMKAWHKRNRTDHKRRQLEDRQKKREWYIQFKKTQSCKRCGENDYSCLHFHHRDPNTKKFTIGASVSFVSSLSVLKAEIRKCDVLCANCHRKEHFYIKHRVTRIP